MNKDITIKDLNIFFRGIYELRSDIEKITGDNVYKRDIIEKANLLGRTWFEKFSKTLTTYNIPEDIIGQYNNSFEKIVSISMKISRKNTYLKEIENITKNWKNEILLPILIYSRPIYSIAELPNILDNVTKEEQEYLTEAIGCAERRFYRASVILCWCAAVQRMHKRVEKIGFDTFNKKSEEMYNIKKGRYKRFDKKFDIHNFSELQANVFDKDLLWMIEYLGLIDSNQNGRLNICLVMRNNAAHPGEATISPENLASFYSDLKTIIFDNPNFLL